jgi:hypothetical protein
MRLKISKENKNELMGALSWSVLEGGLEANFNSNKAAWTNVFPYIGLPHPLPSTDDVLVPATALIPMAIGYKKRNPKIELFGRGAAVYGMGNFMYALSKRVMQPGMGMQYAMQRQYAMQQQYAEAAVQGGKYRAVNRPQTSMAATGAGKYGSTAPLQQIPLQPIRFTNYPRR